MASLTRLWRRTGADLPFGDPLPSHGAEMEGWFWRATDREAGRAVVVLCGVNRSSEGDWATVAVATHPGGAVRSAAVPHAVAAADRFSVAAGDVFRADRGSVHVELDGARVDLALDAGRRWPKALLGGGPLLVLPYLSQYWHPWRLGGAVGGDVSVDGEHWSLDGASLYAERNWGRGFPDRWWWGEAHDFGTADACVAFTGGVLSLGPLRATVGGAVVRVDDRVVRLTPPAALVRTELEPGRWRVRARTPRWTATIEGDANGTDAHLLPVPLPAERRNVTTDLEHLAGRLHVELRDRGRIVFDGESDLAGLEVGALPGQPTYP